MVKKSNGNDKDRVKKSKSDKIPEGRQLTSCFYCKL